MDPFSALSAASSVVGVASFGIQLSQILYQFTSQALSANESPQTIVSGIHATTCALNQIHGILAEECENLERKGRAIFFSVKAIDDVKAISDKCLMIFWRIEATITSKTGSKFEEELIERLNSFNTDLKTKKPSGPIKVDTALISLSKWGRLRWPYIAPKLDNYNSQLQQLQLNLVLIFSVISLGAHRMKPAQREEDLRALVEAYSRIRRMATQADLSQLSPRFGRQELMRGNKLSSTNQHRLGSPVPMAKNLKGDVFSFTSRRHPFRSLSLSPSRSPFSKTPLTPIPLNLSRTVEKTGNENSLQSDEKVRRAASRSTEPVKFNALPEQGVDKKDFTENIIQCSDNSKSTALPNRAALYQERLAESHEPNDVQTTRTTPNGEVSSLKKDSSATNMSDLTAASMPIALSIHSDLNPSNLFRSSAEVISLEPQSSTMQESLQPPANPWSTRIPEKLETTSLQQGAGAISSSNPHALLKSEPVPIILSSSTGPGTENFENSSTAVGQKTPKGTSGTLLSGKDTQNRTKSGEDGSKTRSLRSQRLSPDLLQSHNMFSRLKSILYGKQFVTDPFLEAYIIKNGEAYSVPHSGSWKLSRTEINNLESQPSDPSWYKIFAFLDEDDMAALGEILSKAGDDGTEFRSSIVHLRIFKGRRLGFRFWQAVDQALFVIIRCSPLESLSSAPNRLESERDNLEGIWPGAPPVHSWQSDLPRSTILTSVIVDPQARSPQGLAQQPGRTFGADLPSQTVTGNSNLSAQPYIPAATVVGPPPPAPPAVPQFGAQLPGPQPPLGARITQPRTLPSSFPFPPRTSQSTRYQNMNVASCLKELTSYAAFTISKLPLSNPDEQQTWVRAEIIEERFSQEEIVKQIQKLNKSSKTIAEKKTALSHSQQGQITALLDDLTVKERDRAFEWLIVQLNTAKRTMKPFKGEKKGDAYEVVGLLVYVSRTPVRGLDIISLHQNIERLKAGRVRAPDFSGPAAGTPAVNRLSVIGGQSVNAPAFIGPPANGPPMISSGVRLNPHMSSHNRKEPIVVGHAMHRSHSGFPKSKILRRGNSFHNDSDSNSIGTSISSTTSRKVSTRNYRRSAAFKWAGKNRGRRGFHDLDSTSTESFHSRPDSDPSRHSKHDSRTPASRKNWHPTMSYKPRPRAVVGEPRFYDDDAEILGEDGRDIVQQLLSEWTPSDVEGGEARIDRGNEDINPDDPAMEGSETSEDDKDSEPRGRSPTRRSISSREDGYRKTNVEDMGDEQDEGLSDAINVPLTAKQKGKGKEQDEEEERTKPIPPSSQSESSPVRLSRSQAQRQPSWLDPSWAQKVADTTALPSDT